LLPAAERAQLDPSVGNWHELWSFDGARPDRSLGFHLLVARFPAAGVAWYWAVVVRSGRPVVAVVDLEVPLPRDGSLELRAPGLWADHTLETPFDHWGLGLEAAGVAVDDPADLAGEGWGIPTPLGLDVGWEATDAPLEAGGPFCGYEQPGAVVGEVLVGQERLTIDGPGHRRRWWGDPAGWVTPWRTGAEGVRTSPTREPPSDGHGAPVRYRVPAGCAATPGEPPPAGVLWRWLAADGSWTEHNAPDEHPA
jgi:hypothetical protein